MLFLTIQNVEPDGNCRINGKPAEYRLLTDTLEFRYEGDEMWDKRRIIDSYKDGDLIRLICDDGPGSEGPFCVIRPGVVYAHFSDDGVGQHGSVSQSKQKENEHE